MDNDKFVEELARKYACAVAISENDGWYFPNCDTQATMLSNREDCRRDHNLFTRAIREAMAHAYRDAATIVDHGEPTFSGIGKVLDELERKAKGMTDGHLGIRVRR